MDRRSTVLFVSIFFSIITVIAIIFLLLGSSINRRAKDQLDALFSQEQLLQVQVVQHAIEEKLEQLTDESRILADYSFSEYEAGKRTYESLKTLLNTEIQLYDEVSAYVYTSFQRKDEVSAIDIDDYGNEALNFIEYWKYEYQESLSSIDNSPFIPPFGYSKEYLFCGFFYPVYRDGVYSGILGLVVNLKEAIEEFLIPMEIEREVVPYVLDQDGNILWEPRYRFIGSDITSLLSFTSKSREAFQKRLLGTKEGTGRFSLAGSAGEENDASISWSTIEVNDHSLKIGLITAESRIGELLAVYQDQRTVLIAFLLLLIVASVIIIFRFVRFYRERISLKERHDVLESAVEKRTHELNSLLNRYSSLFNGASDAILLLKERKVVDCNKKTEELFKTSRENFIGTSPLHFSPKYQQNGVSSDKLINRYLKNARNGETQRFEWKHINEEGREFYAEVSLSSVQAGNEIYTQAIIRDITEHKRAMKEKEVMLQEINHRVKNNLQIIKSLIHLQAAVLGEQDAQQILHNMERRISAMLQAHLVLYTQENLAAVPASKYFHEITEYVRSMHAVDTNLVNIEKEFAETRISPDHSIPAGLIMSELFDNAVCHGINGGEGRIRTAFIEENDRYKIEVEDTGPGFDFQSSEELQGLGLQLVKALTHQLSGEFNYFFPKDSSGHTRGTKMQVVFPI